jgi:hypothetical protein
MSKLFAIGKARIRMMEKLGFDEKQSILLGLNSLNIPCDEVKEEINYLKQIKNGNTNKKLVHNKSSK